MSHKLFDTPELKRAIERMASSADGAVIAARLVQEKDVISRRIGQSPQNPFKDWYSGRLGLLYELLDGIEGRTNGG